MVKHFLYDMELVDLDCPTLELYFSTLVTMVTLTPEKLTTFTLCTFIDEV